MSTPRGLRLNNPGDIRHSTADWRGKSIHQPDPDFVNFVCPLYGLRAMARILMAYGRASVDTIGTIAARWAPPIENDTRAWAQTVGRAAGYGLDEDLDMADPATLARLLRGITQAEQGEPEPYQACQYEDGVALAIGVSPRLGPS